MALALASFGPLLGCLEVESEASNERFFPRPSAIESAAVAGQGSIFSL
jgi:hypothetical protein